MRIVRKRGEKVNIADPMMPRAYIFGARVCKAGLSVEGGRLVELDFMRLAPVGPACPARPPLPVPVPETSSRIEVVGWGRLSV